jgi:hypothetical protein
VVSDLRLASQSPITNRKWFCRFLQDVAAPAVRAYAFELVNGDRHHADPAGDGNASLDEMPHDVFSARRVNQHRFRNAMTGHHEPR